MRHFGVLVLACSVCSTRRSSCRGFYRRSAGFNGLSTSSPSTFAPSLTQLRQNVIAKVQFWSFYPGLELLPVRKQGSFRDNLILTFVAVHQAAEAFFFPYHLVLFKSVSGTTFPTFPGLTLVSKACMKAFAQFKKKKKSCRICMQLWTDSVPSFLPQTC